MSLKHRFYHRLYAGTITFLLVFCAVFQAISLPGHAASAIELSPSVDTVLNNVGNYILSVDSHPDYSSTWNVLGLIRSGRKVSSDYINEYYNNTVNYLEDNDWKITRNKFSDYSRLILGMTVIGKDAQDINGHNLFSYLSDFSKVKLQGFNGPIWALIALNSHPDYSIPVNLDAKEQTTEEGLIQYLVSRETSKGGWTLFGDTPDTDITGMTIQALAPYYGKRDDVTNAVDRALSWLSSAQNKDGGYSTLNGSTTIETSESDDQVIVALCALGIDPGQDSRFIKDNGKWVMSRLFEYYIPAGTNKAGFMHTFPGAGDDGGGASGTLNGMATEQGMYATAAYKRLLTGKTALYDMSDLTLTPGEAPGAPTTRATEAETDTTKKTQKVKIKKITLNYKQITVKTGKTRKLKATVTPANATNKKLKWKSSNKRIATVSQTGKVKGIKAGKVKITVAARDGSGKKATCKVIVEKKKSKKIKVTSVSLNYSQISVQAGASRSLSATVLPSNATNKKLRWYSSDSSIASVSGSGSVKGRKNGTATITAKARDGSGSKAVCKVIVYGGTSYSSSNPSSAPSQTPGANQGGGQSSGAQPGSGQGSSGGSAKEDSAAESTTEVGAWSFEGDSFVPEASTEEEENQEEFDDEEMGSEDLAEEEAGTDARSNLPIWLQILLGFGGSGFLAGGFRMPWAILLERLRRLRG